MQFFVWCDKSAHEYCHNKKYIFLNNLLNLFAFIYKVNPLSKRNLLHNKFYLTQFCFNFI